MTSKSISARDRAAYRIAEVARYVRVPLGTLRTWVSGRSYPTRGGIQRFEPLIRPPSGQVTLQSFSNLVEAHVLKALRTDHGIEIAKVRTAIGYAERSLKIDRLLLRKELLAAGGELFLEHYGSLVSLSRSGQLAMKKGLEAYLRRVQWDKAGLPVRLHPFVRLEGDCPQVIAIDPQLAFGRPVLASRSISTATIVERIDAGELPQEIADDYDLSVAEVEEAVVYERAA